MIEKRINNNSNGGAIMRNVIMYGVDKLYGGVCKLKEELDKIRIREMNANKYVIWKEIA